MPHTKSQLQALLQAAQTKPQHKWGQNFLIDLNLMRSLVDEAKLSKTDTILEVGCGTGSLTSLLAENAGGVVAVDIDKNMAQIASGELSQFQNISLIHADALATKRTIEPAVELAVLKAKEHFKGDFKLVANLPYQAASPLILNLLMGQMIPKGIYVTIQAEVADRMVAGPGSKAFGLLSILMQSTGKIRQFKHIPPQAFWPAPQVNSAMITWEHDPEKCQNIISIEMLRKVIELLLGHRRKKIRTCLANSTEDIDFTPLLEKVEINPDSRGETLEPIQFVNLANLLCQIPTNTQNKKT